VNPSFLFKTPYFFDTSCDLSDKSGKLIFLPDGETCVNILCEYMLSVLMANITVFNLLNSLILAATAASSVGQTKVKSEA